MTDRGTIKLPRDVYEHHNERRKQAGLTWSAYIERESVTVDVSVDTEAIAREVADTIGGRFDDLETDIKHKIEAEVRG